MELYVSGIALLLRYDSSLAAVALQCCYGGIVIPLRWQCSARRVAMQCHRSGRTMLRKKDVIFVSAERGWFCEIFFRMGTFVLLLPLAG